MVESVWLYLHAETKASWRKAYAMVSLSLPFFTPLFFFFFFKEMVKYGDTLVLFIVSVYINVVALADCNSCETPPQKCS